MSLRDFLLGGKFSLSLGRVRFPSGTHEFLLAPLHDTRAPGQPLDVIQSAIPPYDGVQETTNARDRAIATTLRIVLLAALLFIAGWLLLQLAPPPGLVIIGGIICLLIGGFVLTRLDYHYSAPGIAHHAIDAAADLAAEQMQLNHSLRQQALNAYLKHLEGRHD